MDFQRQDICIRRDPICRWFCGVLGNPGSLYRGAHATDRLNICNSWPWIPILASVLKKKNEEIGCLSVLLSSCILLIIQSFISGIGLGLMGVMFSCVRIGKVIGHLLTVPLTTCFPNFIVQITVAKLLIFS